MSRTTLLWLSVALLASSCSKTFPEYHYKFLFPGKEAPERAELMLGDQMLGTVFTANETGGSQPLPAEAGSVIRRLKVAN